MKITINVEPSAAETSLLVTWLMFFYIEALERKTFIYTDKEVFDSEMKLYELEAALAQYNFIRVSKNTICSLSKIKTLKSEVDRKIKITMENDYQIIASRMYADELREKLGVSCTIIITTLLEKRMMTK